MTHWKRYLQPAALIVLALFYLSYVAFLITNDQAPIDYINFMEIGSRLRAGESIYTVNSYYPMPFVMLFAFLSWLPRLASLLIWLLVPVICALAISRWNPAVLLFAPLFGHFAGGQTAVFAMLGVWGYRRQPDLDRFSGGFWLALTAIKPHLGIIPTLYAFVQWARAFRERRRIPRQALGWLFWSAAIYLPGFLILPDWPLQWLRNPRPLFTRAMAGILPRTLIQLIPAEGPAFWAILVGLSAALLAAIWLINNRRLDLDLALLWSFVTFPILHDYDLIEIIPLLDTAAKRWAAILLSAPTWLVIFSAYASDRAWYAVTIIAPGLLALLLYQRSRRQTPAAAGESIQPA